jgi:general secretion pathway protein G
MKARKGGFTLVELLIVIMIIAILAGMMLLATGSATDGAEATKVINDLRNLKSAALLFYADNNQWPTSANLASLDQYTDRPMVADSIANNNDSRYAGVQLGTEYQDSQGNWRQNIGVTLKNASATAGVKKKLIGKAKDSGLYEGVNGDTVFNGTGNIISMNMR